MFCGEAFGLYLNRNKNSGDKPVNLVNERPSDLCGSYVVPVFVYKT